MRLAYQPGWKQYVQVLRGQCEGHCCPPFSEWWHPSLKSDNNLSFTSYHVNLRVVLKERTEFTFWQKNNLDLGEHEESHLERRGSGGAGGGGSVV